MRYLMIFAVIVMAVAVSRFEGAAADDKIEKEGQMTTVKTESLSLRSEVFKAGEVIPRKYTCDGADVSPSLSWGGVPREAQELVLICEDPDAPAGLWTHWLLYGLSPETVNVTEGIPKKDAVSGARQGKNTFGKVGYGGPCPPRGSTHRYFFKLYAVDRALDLKPGADRETVTKAIEGHVLAQGELMGRYGR